MTAVIEWRQWDDYYWSGPPGWTICRVWISGTYQFELWHSSEGAQRRIAARPSLSDAQALYLLQVPPAA